MLRDLFGEIFSASALTVSVNPGVGKVDTMNSRFSTEKGLIIDVNQFYSAHGIRVNTIHIFGDRGTIVIDNDSCNIILAKNGETILSETTDEERGYIGEYDDFFRAIQTGIKVVSSFEEAYQDLKVILSALESSEKGETIRLEP